MPNVPLAVEQINADYTNASRSDGGGRFFGIGKTTNSVRACCVSRWALRASYKYVCIYIYIYIMHVLMCIYMYIYTHNKCIYIYIHYIYIYI